MIQEAPGVYGRGRSTVEEDEGNQVRGFVLSYHVGG